MTGEPLVSVIVPAWNSERTLLETLQSVSAQSHANLEIVIVDDGSTDRTAAVAQGFCQSEPRARLIQTQNMGVSCARNRGIAEARADWVAPIDSDDLWHPTKIEKQLRKALGASGKMGFVYCWHRQIDEDGRVLASGPSLALKGRVFSRFAYINPVANGSAPLFSRRALVEVGGYDEDLPPYEDPMVQLRIAARYEVDLVPEYLVGWRRHSRNASNDVDLIGSRASAMYARLAAERLRPLPPRIIGWAMAQNAVYTAEDRVRRRRPISAIGWLARALWEDPARTGLELLHRGARAAKRALAGPAPQQRKLVFEAVDPASATEADPFAIGSLTAATSWLDEYRFRRLEKLEGDEEWPFSNS